MLLYAGADPNSSADIYVNANHDKGSRSCLQIATERGFVHIVDLLLDN
jgi:ankyrin repeat protein